MAKLEELSEGEGLRPSKGFLHSPIYMILAFTCPA
jgi:hypothetical protein